MAWTAFPRLKDLPPRLPPNRQVPAAVKLRVVGLPFVPVAAAFAVGVAAIEVLLRHALAPVPPSPLEARVLLPLALTPVPLLVWLRPHLRAFHRDHLAFVLVAVLALFFPASFLGHAVVGWAAKLERVADASGIAARAHATNLAMESPCLVPADRRGVSRRRRIGIKNENPIVLSRHVAVPFCSPGGHPDDAPAWLALTAREKVSSGTSGEERTQVLERLEREEWIDPEEAGGTFLWLEELDRSERRPFEDAIRGRETRAPAGAATQGTAARPLRILTAHHHPFEEGRELRVGNAVVALAIASAVWCLMTARRSTARSGGRSIT